jgi:hypothetical protein
MTDREYARKLEELDHLLNDPDVPINPDRIWSLLAELSPHAEPGGRCSHPGMRAGADEYSPSP